MHKFSPVPKTQKLQTWKNARRKARKNENMNLLSIQNVRKSYEGITAVDGISLEIAGGSIFGLLGPNGAGKTTLIRMITNILVQDDGSIILHGIPDNSERKYHIGYMPEERGLYKKMKVGEQLRYLARLKGVSLKDANEGIARWLEKFDLTDRIDRNIEDLSKGMQQKVQFISTVLHNPRLIILDEPFSGLDPINANLIRSEIFALKRKGATIIFSTHRMEQAEEICERIALINKGQIILDGDIVELKHRFKQNKFDISYEGNFPDITERMFQIDFNSDNRMLISLKENHNGNDVLKYLLSRNMHITGFNEVLPSLNEIFIHRVSQTNTAHRSANE